MGSCICKYVEMNKTEVLINPSHDLNSQEDLNSSNSSEEFPQAIEDWQAFKSVHCRSFNDSTGLLSTLQQSERKISVYSKPASVGGSFIVSLSK